MSGPEFTFACDLVSAAYQEAMSQHGILRDAVLVISASAQRNLAAALGEDPEPAEPAESAPPRAPVADIPGVPGWSHRASGGRRSGG